MNVPKCGADGEALAGEDYALHMRQQFRSFEEFKTALLKWALHAHFSPRIRYSNKRYKVAVCMNAPKECPFRVRAVWKDKKQCVEITVLKPDHTACLGAAPAGRSPLSNLAFLTDTVAEYLQPDSDIRAQEVQNVVAHRLGYSLDYAVCYRVARKLQERFFGHERAQFELLPAYCQVLQTKDPSGSFILELDPFSNEFQRIFICPSASKNVLAASPPLLFIEAGRAAANYHHTLFFAACLDGNGELALLCWALVEEETQGSWQWFMSNMKRSLPSLETLHPAIIIDGEVGSQSAVLTEMPGAHVSLCWEALGSKIREAFGSDVLKTFQHLAATHSPDQFQQALVSLWSRNALAHDFLQSLSPASFSNAFFPTPRFGIRSLQPLRLLFQRLSGETSMAVLDCLMGIWDTEMDTRAKRVRTAEQYPQGTKYTTISQRSLKQAIAGASKYDVVLDQNAEQTSVAVVKERSTVKYDAPTFHVSLSEKTCSCGLFQDTWMPCAHAVAVMYKLRYAPDQYMPTYSTVGPYVSGYSSAFPVVMLDDVRSVQYGDQFSHTLAPDEDASLLAEVASLSGMESELQSISASAAELKAIHGGELIGDGTWKCAAPTARGPGERKAGRKKKKVMGKRESGETGPKRRMPKCSVCRQVGHYKTKCPLSEVSI